jgi:hypothetical protein
MPTIKELDIDEINAIFPSEPPKVCPNCHNQPLTDTTAKLEAVVKAMEKAKNDYIAMMEDETNQIQITPSVDRFCISLSALQAAVKAAGGQ